MRRHLLVLLFIGLFSSAAARDRYPINDRWEFFFGYRISSDLANYVSLPHTWNADAGAASPDYLRGTGNYLKNINIPSEWNGRRVFIRFNGASIVTDLWVNGRYVGSHRGAAAAFTFEITKFLNYGAVNSFRVTVDNTTHSDILPLAPEENCYGGLYRDVELIVTDPIAISPLHYSSDGIYVTPQHIDSSRVEGRIDIHLLSGFSERQAQVDLAIISPANDTVFHDQARVKLDTHSDPYAFSMPFKVENPQLWGAASGDQPLYKVAVRLEAGASRDSVVVTTGFRSIAMEEGRNVIRLNGKPYRIQGVTLTTDRAAVGTALLPQHIDEDMALVEECGANTVRMMTQPAAQRYFDICDRRGITVWCDMPLINSPFIADCAFNTSKELAENGRQQLREIIAQNYNHPSVIIWGIFSKLSVPGDDPRPYIRELDSLAKQIDPTRLTGAISNQDGDINFITDLIVWDQAYGWLNGEMDELDLWKKMLRDNWSTLHSGLTYSAGGSPMHQDTITRRPRVEQNWHPEQWHTRFHEYYLRTNTYDTLFWGIIAGNMFDFGAARRTQINGLGINDYGLVTFDRRTPKDAFYLYKALWNHNDPFVYIAERRWTRREDSKQTIRVFSNQATVELFVNGVSLGGRNGRNGIFVWRNVALQPGENRIEAVVPNSELHDSCEVTIGRILR